MGRETRSTRRIPKSDNLPDRSAPSFPYRCSRQKLRAAPALATIPPSRCSDKPRRQESGIVCAIPPSTLLRLNYKACCPAASAAPAGAGGSTSAVVRAHLRRPQCLQTKTKNHGDRSALPPQGELRGFYDPSLSITTGIPRIGTCSGAQVGLSLRGISSG